MADNDLSDPVSDITSRILNGRPPNDDEADGYTEDEYFDRYHDQGDAKPGTIRVYDSITGHLIDVTITIIGPYVPKGTDLTSSERARRMSGSAGSL